MKIERIELGKKHRCLPVHEPGGSGARSIGARRRGSRVIEPRWILKQELVLRAMGDVRLAVGALHERYDVDVETARELDRHASATETVSHSLAIVAGSLAGVRGATRG
jgi:hypothetical protein